MSNPAFDSSALYQAGYRNGSLLAGNLQNNPIYMTYLQNASESNVKLTVFPNNVTGLTFNTNDATTLPLFLAQVILDTDNYSIGVWCINPLSGQYDVLPRALFYLLIVFSLLFRRHNWLATAALGTAMTYAATSAVHMFALLTQFDWKYPADAFQGNLKTSAEFGDVDVYGIFPILSAAAIMLTPILNWSAQVRGNEAQTVVVIWGVLVFAALVPAWVFANSISHWIQNSPASFALCPYSAATTTPTCGPSMDLTTYSYNQCQCIDFCGLIGPSTPLRHGANMVPWLGRPISEVAYSKPLEGLLKFNEFVLGFIVIQGIFGFIEAQFTQAEVRNLVFRTLYAGPKDFILILFEGEREERWLKKFGLTREPYNKSTFRWEIQFQLGRFVASSFFVFAVIFAVVCPAVFVTSVVAQEVFLTEWPVSEHSDAVGAWSIWVGATFVLIAAIIVRYHEAWGQSIKVGWQAFWRLVAFATNERHARFQSDKHPEKIRDRIASFVAEVSSPAVHLWYSTRRAWWTLSYTFTEFGTWFRDPDTHSRQQRRDAVEEKEQAWKATGPKCPCQMCVHAAETGKDTDDQTKQRKASTTGEKLVDKTMQRYQHAKPDEEEEMAAMPDYGLPRILTNPTISSVSSVAEGDGGDRKASKPKPITAAVQPRQPYTRQDSESHVRPSHSASTTARPYSIPRKPVTPSPSVDEVPGTPDEAGGREGGSRTSLLLGPTSPEVAGAGTLIGDGETDADMRQDGAASREEAKGQDAQPERQSLLSPRSSRGGVGGGEYDRLPSR